MESDAQTPPAGQPPRRRRRLARNLILLFIAGAGTAGMILLASPPLPAALRIRIPQVAPMPRVAVPGAGAPWRVGIQIGHLDAAQLPDELQRLRNSTGAYADGIAEAEVNRAVAEAAREILTAAGVEVTLLPATIPPGFAADAFVAIHADGSRHTELRGYKVSPPWRASPASRQLVAALHDHYGAATGMPVDLNGVTYNMRGYYAFNSFRYRHAIAPTTPAAILELGYLSSRRDREYLLAHPDTAAAGLAAGVLAYLDECDPFDRWDTVPVEARILYAPRDGITVYAAPHRSSTARRHVRKGELLFTYGGAGDWYDVRVRGSYRDFGWVHAADLGVPPPE